MSSQSVEVVTFDITIRRLGTSVEGQGVVYYPVPSYWSWGAKRRVVAQIAEALRRSDSQVQIMVHHDFKDLEAEDLI